MALAGTVATMPAHAAAPSPDYVSLYGGSVNVVSSAHTKLTVDMYASKSLGAEASKTGNVSVDVSKRDHSETHSWYIPIPASAIQASMKGKGSVKTKLGPYGKVALKFKKSKSAKVYNCGGAISSRTWQGTISGTFFFNTKSSGRHKWGAVGSKSKTFHFSTKSYLTFGYASTGDCGGGTPTIPCTYGTTWNVSAYNKATHISTSLYGFLKQGASHAAITGSRNTQLARPQGASRTDIVTTSAPKPKLTTTSGGATLLAKGPNKTSGKITSSNPGYPALNTCGRGDKTKYTQTSWSGSLVSGKHPLSVPADIFGAITVKSDKYAYFSRSKPGAPPSQAQ